MKILFKLNFIFFFTSLIANSQWSTKQLNSVKNFSSLTNNHYVATVWAQARSRPLSVARIKGAKVLNYKNSTLFNDSLPIAFKKSQSTTINQKITFIIPGLFGNYDSLANLKLMSLLSKQGQSVVSLSNPWSIDFINASPKNLKSGRLIEEGAFFLEVIKDILDSEFNGVSFSEVNLSGFSYGALLASVVKNYDLYSSSPIINGQLTLFSPPVNLLKSVENIDTQLDLYEQDAIDMAKKPKLLWSMLLDYATKSNPKNLHPLSKQYAPYIVLYTSFLKGMVQSFSSLNSKLAFTTDLRFSDLINSMFEPDRIISYQKKFGKLEYWLGTLNVGGYNKIRVLSTEDDFLNNKSQWNIIRKELPSTLSDNFIILPSSGHVGYISYKWFEELIQD